jgi:4-hydroxy-3-methylbut-2-en-1-yl diphosphate reductase
MAETVVRPGGPGLDAGVLLAMSYVNDDGSAVGIGAAVRAADFVRAQAVRDAVGVWSALVRTRRVLLARPLSRAVISRIATAARRAREFAGRGDAVLVIGRPGAAASEVLAQAPGATVLITSVTRARTANVPDPGRVSFVVVPGFPVEDAADIAAVLRARLPLLRGQHPGEFCYAASDRREAVRSVAAASDLVLVCDPDGDPDTSAMVRSIGFAADRVRRVSEIGQVRAEWLVNVATVGVVGASSAGERLVWETVVALSGLGPLAVATRAVSTEHLGGAIDGWIEAPSTGSPSGVGRRA